MTEVANIPGLYRYNLASEQFGLSEQYYEFAEYYGTENYFAEAVVLYVNGVEQVGGINSTQQTQLFALPDAAANAAAGRIEMDANSTQLAKIDLIPAAVLSAADAAPISCHVKIVHNVVLKGSGVPGDSMRPA